MDTYDQFVKGELHLLWPQYLPESVNQKTCQRRERNGIAFDRMSSLLLMIFLNMYKLKAIYTCMLTGHTSDDTSTL